MIKTLDWFMNASPIDFFWGLLGIAVFFVIFRELIKSE